jgi:glycerol uptake facilitator-like aquaporin
LRKNQFPGGYRIDKLWVHWVIEMLFEAHLNPYMGVGMALLGIIGKNRGYVRLYQIMGSIGVSMLIFAK